MKRKHFLNSLLISATGLSCGMPQLQASALNKAEGATPAEVQNELKSTDGQAVDIPRGQVKITEVKAYRFRKACFIKVETDAGINGWGESDGATKMMTPQYVQQYLKDYYLDKDPFDSEGLWHEVYLRELEMGMSGLHPGTLAGIDNAIWDLKGKLLGLPVHKLLGGNGKQQIRVYGSYGRDAGRAGMRSAEEMARIAANFVEQGYQAVKARLQIRQHRVNPFPDDTYEVVGAVRQAIGDDIPLMVDFNNGYTPAEATMMGRRLHEAFNIAALEEPVFQQDIAGLRQVSDSLDLPIMAGEHEYNKYQILRLLNEARVDIINADPIKCGGITECKKAATLAHAFGKQIMVHNAKPTLATAASLQLLASIPNGANFQEYAGRRLDQGYDELVPLFDNYFDFKDGHLHLPTEPGLGLVVNEAEMEARALP
ncbi:MAG: mandelate racemase/muconate lactonizing enzyme family protein [Bacteroidota bacterium]